MQEMKGHPQQRDTPREKNTAETHIRNAGDRDQKTTCIYCTVPEGQGGSRVRRGGPKAENKSDGRSEDAGWYAQRATGKMTLAKNRVYRQPPSYGGNNGFKGEKKRGEDLKKRETSDMGELQGTSSREKHEEGEASGGRTA